MKDFDKNYLTCIPEIIPQEYGVYDTWDYFIHKACNGSYKAEEILTNAEYGLMAFKTGIEEPTTQNEAENYYKILENQFSNIPPFKSRKDLLAQLLKACELSEAVVIKEKYYFTRDQYQSLWQKKYVDPHKLLHDAILNAYKNWGYKTYKQIQELLLEEDYFEFNSLDIVTSMIMLVSSFIEDCPKAFMKESYSI